MPPSSEPCGLNHPQGCFLGDGLSQLPLLDFGPRGQGLGPTAPSPRPGQQVGLGWQNTDQGCRLQTQLQPLPTDEWGCWGGGLSTRCLGASFWTWGTATGLARLSSAHSARRLRRVQLTCAPESPSELQACLVVAQDWLPPEAMRQAAATTTPAKNKPQPGSWEALRFPAGCLAHVVPGIGRFLPASREHVRTWVCVYTCTHAQGRGGEVCVWMSVSGKEVE